MTVLSTEPPFYERISAREHDGLPSGMSIAASVPTKRPGARDVHCAALLGFGGWHIVDALLSHWLTGIHRIRTDSPDPLMWDLIWLFAFGVLPAVAGWWVLRRPGAGPSDSAGRRAATALTLAALIAGPIAALPAASDPTQIVVVFRPGVSAPQAFDVLARIDARVAWVDRGGGLWAVRLAEPQHAWQLYRHGAMLVSNAGFSLGYVSWTRATP